MSKEQYAHLSTQGAAFLTCRAEVARFAVTKAGVARVLATLERYDALLYDAARPHIITEVLRVLGEQVTLGNCTPAARVAVAALLNPPLPEGGALPSGEPLGGMIAPDADTAAQP